MGKSVSAPRKETNQTAAQKAAPHLTIMSQIDTSAVRKQFQLHDKDTGSSDVQIAILTKRIEHLTEHLKTNAKDHNSRRGLIAMVNNRRKLLDYLKRTENERYLGIIRELGIRR